jgi:hypothetical protein
LLASGGNAQLEPHPRRADLMPHKYEAQVCILDSCPPGDCAPAGGDAFRFFFADTDDERNLKPVLSIKPKRGNAWSDAERCSGWALSCYLSLEMARAHYLAILDEHPNFHKSVGTCVAGAALAPDDGVITQADDLGHFDLHESDGADLAGRFTIIEQVYQP